MKRLKKILLWAVMLVCLTLPLLTGCSGISVGKNINNVIETIVQSTSQTAAQSTPQGKDDKSGVVQGQEYSSKDQVAAYIHEFGKLPANYITKKEAENLGWDNKKGNLWEVAPGKSIGGSYFGNYEGKLPEASGRKYYECDINYEGGYRGAERIIYSNDGLVYYTADHYESFEKLY